jgi:hypothetical protein
MKSKRVRRDAVEIEFNHGVSAPAFLCLIKSLIEPTISATWFALPSIGSYGLVVATS